MTGNLNYVGQQLLRPLHNLEWRGRRDFNVTQSELTTWD
uniref:Uncharacterized protein n=1 Tax=Anguilla anguilla TaxID=7936 RepID=A0A0E9TAN0_ANGAN